MPARLLCVALALLSLPVMPAAVQTAGVDGPNREIRRRLGLLAGRLTRRERGE